MADKNPANGLGLVHDTNVNASNQSRSSSWTSGSTIVVLGIEGFAAPTTELQQLAQDVLRVASRPRSVDSADSTASLFPHPPSATQLGSPSSVQIGLGDIVAVESTTTDVDQPSPPANVPASGVPSPPPPSPPAPTPNLVSDVQLTPELGTVHGFEPAAPPIQGYTQQLVSSLDQLVRGLKALDTYHQSLVGYVSSQRDYRDALRVELERVEREAKRARLLDRLARFERARASKDAAELVRKRSSSHLASKRMLRTRRSWESQVSGGGLHRAGSRQGRVFSRSAVQATFAGFDAEDSLDQAVEDPTAQEESNGRILAVDIPRPSAPTPSRAASAASKPTRSAYGTRAKRAKILEAFHLMRGQSE
jgi:hypothetical protein